MESTTAMLCRICTIDCDQVQYVSIYERDDGKSLAEMISFCGQLLITAEDALPKIICTGCWLQLVDAYRFCMRCRAGDDKLRDQSGASLPLPNLSNGEEKFELDEELPDKIVDELMELPAAEPKNQNEILVDLMTRRAEEMFDEIIEEERFVDGDVLDKNVDLENHEVPSEVGDDLLNDELQLQELKNCDLQNELQTTDELVPISIDQNFNNMLVKNVLQTISLPVGSVETDEMIVNEPQVVSTTNDKLIEADELFVGEPLAMSASVDEFDVADELISREPQPVSPSSDELAEADELIVNEPQAVVITIDKLVQFVSEPLAMSASNDDLDELITGVPQPVSPSSDELAEAGDLIADEPQDVSHSNYEFVEADEIIVDEPETVSFASDEVAEVDDLSAEESSIRSSPTELIKAELSSLEGERIALKVYDNNERPLRKRAACQLPPQEMIADREDHGEYGVIYYNGVSCCGCDRYFINTESLEEHCREKHHLEDPPEAHYCELCHKSYPSLNHKIRHQSIRAIPKLYICNLCGYICWDQGAIDRHMKSAVIHNKPMLDFDKVKEVFQEVPVEGYLCCECFQCFPEEELLNEHLADVHHQNRLDSQQNEGYWCMKCHQAFKNKCKYEVHLRNASAKVIYYCKYEFCSYRTACIVFARFHLRSQDHKIKVEPKDDSNVTNDNSERRCCFRKCLGMFKSQQALMEHVDQVHKAKRLENELRRKKSTNVCLICHCNFGSRKALKLHRKSKFKDFICDKCGVTMASSFQLQQHMKKIHKKIEVQRDFKCDECQRSFVNAENLRRHKERGHTSVEEYVCTICGKEFTVKENLWTHWRAHNRVEKFECELCKTAGRRYIFWDQKTLNRHYRISKMHGGVRKYKCCYENCTNAYTHRSDLQRHEAKVHEGIRPFVCKVCNKGFIRNRDLRLHERLHTGAKLYTCEVCMAEFNVHQQYKEHCKEAHGFSIMIQYVRNVSE
ncbi:zinc finger protein 595-like isoform X1 [Topomyia yanbarensis]|uniref:zinc finger protein 595-like isoform X1 n=1 Tax=Topomyia yanbarensis TaxID=2498891 RepID=UPI00273CC0F4|nr:zinc finger protein 595-like isoform X1 [Topomyia yanbarensis]